MKMEVTINQVSPETSGSNQGWVLVNVKLMPGLLGMAACVAWMVVMLATGIASGMTAADEFSLMIAHLTYIVGIVISLFVAAIVPDAIAGHRIAYFAIAAVLAAASLGVLWLNWLPNDSFLWMAFFVNGAASGCLYVLYGEYLATYFSNGIGRYIVGLFLITALIFAFLFFVSSDYGIIYEAVLSIAAFAGYVTQIAFYKVHKLPYVKRAESVKRNRIAKRSYLATATGGMAIGFALGCVMVTQKASGALYFIMALAALVTCVYMLYDFTHEHRLTETVAMRWFLPVVAFLALPMLFVSEFFICLLAIVMLCWAFIPEICSLSAVCRHIELCNLSAIGTFAFGRWWSMFGMLLGMALAFAGLSQYAQELWGAFSLIGAVCVFILIVIVSASFVMTEDNFPTEERIRIIEEGGDPSLVTVGRGTPMRKLDTRSDADDEADPAKRVSVFQLKCDVVAEQYGLSKRQKEVLSLLARGRNADYITEKLVISPHTAKAHTYNIYLKLDVHSRQELMDLVENTVIPEEVLKAARQ